MVNSPFIRPYFLGGSHWVVPLDSHDVSGRASQESLKGECLSWNRRNGFSPIRRQHALKKEPFGDGLYVSTKTCT